MIHLFATVKTINNSEMRKIIGSDQANSVQNTEFNKQTCYLMLVDQKIYFKLYNQEAYNFFGKIRGVFSQMFK